ncbi:uncharacterized protein N7487_006879 [Penicillium crustosum]|uniref:uncharacterized protein n=1 Tax=Penicillium crustosum TaxID=36656 RepID=UPI00238ED451|nr:uncharacterized protein N7487_006879 [Penicillium crustosum]KAJ5412520.1 hypothetical protein N7487_006879 [Penicillium crustosum]
MVRAALRFRGRLVVSLSISSVSGTRPSMRSAATFGAVTTYALYMMVSVEGSWHQYDPRDPHASPPVDVMLSIKLKHLHI